MRFSYVMLPDYPLDDCIDYIKTADELGFYACYSVDETWHKDLWVLFAAAARETKNIRFGPNVTHVFLREPTLICQQMATLDELTGGRTEIVVSTGNFGLLSQYKHRLGGPQAALAPERGHARDAHLPRRGRDHVRGRLLQVRGPVHVRPARPGQDPDQDGRDEGPALVPDGGRARRRHAPGAGVQPRGLRLQLREPQDRRREGRPRLDDDRQRGVGRDRRVRRQRRGQAGRAHPRRLLHLLDAEGAARAPRDRGLRARAGGRGAGRGRRQEGRRRSSSRTTRRS